MTALSSAFSSLDFRLLLTNISVEQIQAFASP